MLSKGFKQFSYYENVFTVKLDFFLNYNFDNKLMKLKC